MCSNYFCICFSGRTCRHRWLHCNSVAGRIVVAGCAVRDRCLRRVMAAVAAAALCWIVKFLHPPINWNPPIKYEITVMMRVTSLVAASVSLPCSLASWQTHSRASLRMGAPPPPFYAFFRSPKPFVAPHCVDEIPPPPWAHFSTFGTSTVPTRCRELR